MRRLAAPAAGVSITSSTRAALRRTRWSVCVAVGRPVTSSKDDQRDQREPREQHAVRACPRGPPSTPTSSAPHIARPQHSVVRPWPMPAVRALAPRDARQQRVRGERAPQLLGSAAVDEQLGRALDQVDDAGGQLRARRRLARLAASREPPRQPRHERRGEQQRDQQDQPGGGQHPPHQRDRRRARRRARSRTAARRAAADPAARRRRGRAARADRRSRNAGRPSGASRSRRA